MKDLTVGNLEISSYLDKEGDLEIENTCGYCEGNNSSWINKSEALEIILHLGKVFKLKGG